MDGKGRAMDNIVVERLWRSVKYEGVYLRDCQSVGELKATLKSTSPSITPSGPRCMMLAATSCWQRSHGGLCSERFVGNSRPIRVPWGIYIMVTCLWTCGRVLWIGLRPSGRVDSSWTTLRVAHRLPTLSGLSPTGSIALQQQIFIFYFFWGLS